MLSHIIKRTFAILQERGVILPLPAILRPDPTEKNPRPQNLIIEYVSPLARAQKMSEIGAINNVMAIVGNLATAQPQVLDKIDLDKTVDEVADIHGINPELIRDKVSVKKIRDARATANEAARKMQMAQAGANVIKTGAEAKAVAKETE